MAWDLTFSPHMDIDIGASNFDEALFQSTRDVHTPTLKDSEVFSFLDADNTDSGQLGCGVRPSTNQLLELQYRLYNLSKRTDEEASTERPTVEEILVATNSLLEFLQTSVAAQSCPAETTTTALANGYSSSRAEKKATTRDPITVLQILTCYSYVLHVWDPAVGAMVVQAESSATERSRPIPGESCQSSPSPVLSFGLFNLASQPALTANIVLHTVRRMICELRASIHALASGYEQDMDEGSGESLTDNSTPTKVHTIALDVSSQPVLKAIGKREKILVDTLSRSLDGL